MKTLLFMETFIWEDSCRIEQTKDHPSNDYTFIIESKPKFYFIRNKPSHLSILLFCVQGLL